MFNPIKHVTKPPEKPIMVWDGECGFCKYWVTVWHKNTEDRLQYEKYQDVHERFRSIPLKEFKKASRMIETDGQVFSGPDSAYRSFMYFRSPIKYPHRWYHKYKFFKSLSDHTYNWIAKHRPFMFKLTKLFWGPDPQNSKPFWLGWLLVLILIFFGLINY